ncbi:hypothetical protein BC939DRAFT_446470 [Gamsiella multidivaricata]|uniref:uncharacterized protein n=1 Tax=Gamsiella multidivaricata TaxID=101098 RepID=UPI00221E69D9|nr:uncharacterized protein BC939DRAFT_446470 [Gamsiella multidivaricata]KAI7827003.1 hypothetical protein BC939DRAFT_446470 [Gamsiella multidivaricata]
MATPSLSRKHSSSSRPSYSLSFLLPIVFVGSCLLSTHFVAAGAITRDQIYAQNGFVQNWVAPMPSAPIATNSSPSTNGGIGGDTYITQNWLTTYKTIATGGNDIAFVPDPFSSGGTNASNPVLQINYPKGSYAPSVGPIKGGAQFYARPFGDKTPFERMMISYDIAFPNGFNWVLGKCLLNFRAILGS